MLEQEITDFKRQGKANRTTLNLESGATENSDFTQLISVDWHRRAGTHEECVCRRKPSKGDPELGTP